MFGGGSFGSLPFGAEPVAASGGVTVTPGTAVFPDRMPTRQAIVSPYCDILRALPQPIAPNGWDAYFPWSLRKAKPADSWLDAPLAFFGAATGANPIGWEPVSPWKLRKAPTDAGTFFYPLNQQPAAALGWEPLFPWSLSRKARQTEDTLLPFVLPIYSWGWGTEVPAASPTKRQPRADVHQVYVSPATAGTSPNGWEIAETHPWRRPAPRHANFDLPIQRVVLAAGGTPIFRSGILGARIVGPKGFVV